MQVIINGEPRDVPDGVTVSELIEFLGLDGSRVAVECDRSIVTRDLWAETPVAEGAKLEIVMFVGGG